MSAPALLVLLCLTQAPPPLGSVEATADSLTVTPSTRAMHLEGNATLRQGRLSLRAGAMDYDPTAGRVRAEGGVVFSEGLLGGTALRLDVDLGTQTGTFEQATLFQKGHATPEEVAQARTPVQMRLVGKNELTLRAEVVRRLSADSFEAEGLYLTPCDCAEPRWLTEPPSWSVRARHARIAPGESARLAWATLYVKDVPVLPVPLLLLPLSNRQTGFLLPRPNYAATNGFQLEEPFFWALGRSWDATFTPGYFFGETHLDSHGLGEALPGVNYGMQGPRLGTELRYTPSAGTRGKLDFALVYDLKPEGDSAHRGLRGDLAWSHVQDLGAGFSDRLDVAAISDQRYFRDVTADVIAAQQSYLPSTARVDHRSASTDAYLTGSYYQALSGTPQPLDSVLPFFGPRDVNRDTFQRLPAFAFAVQESGLGPLRLSGQVDGAHYAPLSSRVPQLCNPHVDNQACTLDAPLVAAREIDSRVGVQTEVRLPLQLGPFAELAPYGLLRADAWHVETADQADRARAFPVLGATLQTELARTFGPAGGVRWRHVIEPAVEVRAVPGAVGVGPEFPNDELDAPIGEVPTPGGPTTAWPIAGSSGRVLPTLFQGVVAVHTRLDRKEGSSVTEPVRGEVGQGYDFARGLPGDSFADLSLQLGPLQASGRVRYDINQRRLAEVAGRAVWTTAGGNALTLGYARLRSFLTDPMRAGLFDLVGPPASADGGELAERLDIGAHWRASPALAFDLGLSYLPNATQLEAFSSTGSTPGISPAWQRLLSYSAGVTYGSPCDCWGLHLGALFQPAFTAGKPFVPSSFFLVLDAHRIGGTLGGS